MKRKRRRASALTPGEITANFTRGMIASGLLTAIQERWARGEQPPTRKKILRYAVQGGAALAAGAAAADSLRSRDYAGAVLALAAGTAGVIAAEHLLNPAPPPAHEENGLG
ncbi:MAG TPA: hypothetical protein VD978_03205 [Azospirillum sp.]|nr:hypothetical protein [Azospirillum sp.]